MAILTVSIPHQLPRAEVKRRMDDLVDQLRRESAGLLGPVEARWQGDTLEFQVLPMGTTVAGQAAVEDQAVLLEITLPWFLSALAGPIRQAVESRGQRLLERR